MTHSGRARFTLGTAAALVAVGILAVVHAQQGGGAKPMPAPYKEVPGWLKAPPGVKVEGVIGIIPDEQGNVWMLQRGQPAILKMDKDGNVIKSFTHPDFIHTHGFCMDHEGNLWAGDSGAAYPNTPDAKSGKGLMFHKFNQDGKLLMTLGKVGVSQLGNDVFVSPNACAIAPNGDIIIADGHVPRAANEYVGDRLVRFSKDGKFIRTYGKTGTGPGEFRGPHQLAYDSQGRLFVADRNNDRIQIFDKNMNYVTEWRQFGRPSGMVILKDDTLLTTDTESGHANTWLDWPDQDPKLPRNPGFYDGVRVGSAKTGKVFTHFSGRSSESIGGDMNGNIWVGAVKYVKTN